MRKAGFALSWILASLSLFSQDLPIDMNNSMSTSTLPPSATETSSIQLVEFIKTADNNQSIDQNLSDDLNSTNWFYYRDFLTGMDTVYEYGTDAVIVMGSGVDYSLYWLFSSEEELRTGEMNATTSSSDINVTSVGIMTSADDNETVEGFVETQIGKQKLPEQLGDVKGDSGEKTYLMSQWFDKETINSGFLDMSNESYIRLRGGYSYDKKGESETIYSIAARIKIPRTKDKLDLIVGDETRSSSDLTLEGTESERDNSIALGVNKTGLLDLFDTRFRVGFSGITNPYTKYDIQYEALFGKWLFQPSQTFKYSYDVEFEEWTNVNFSKRISDDAMFSFLMQRSTVSRVDGMDYFFQPAVSISLGSYGSLTPYIGAYGRTKEQPEDDDGYRPKRGIYRYAVGVNWFKQSSRKYIYYRIQPIIAYEDKYDFKENYYVKFLLEFYFGLRD